MYLAAGIGQHCQTVKFFLCVILGCLKGFMRVPKRLDICFKQLRVVWCLHSYDNTRMESKVNYTWVGLFVVILGLSLIVIAFWLSAGFSEKHYKTYRAYMNESVTGLSENAPVKYNGVDVGIVRKISLNPANPSQVRLTLDIEQKIPISVETTATLMSQGLTGISFVNLTGGSPGSPPLEVKEGQRYPVIKTAPSLLLRLDTIVRELSESLTGISQDIRSLLNEENRKEFKQILKNLEVLSDGLSKEMAPAIVDIQEMSKKLGRASSDTSMTMQESRLSIKKLTDHLNDVMNELQANPSVILRGKQPLPPGPGE